MVARAICLAYPRDKIRQTASGISNGDSIEVRLREWMTPPRNRKDRARPNRCGGRPYIDAANWPST